MNDTEAVKRFFEHNDIFADLMNVQMFDGKQVIDPDDLEDVDEETLRNTSSRWDPDDMICKYWRRGRMILRLGGISEWLEETKRMLAEKKRTNDGTRED